MAKQKHKPHGKHNARIGHGHPSGGRGFTPFRAPTRPPTGTYDPALDAQQAASGRGLADLVMDTERGRGRSFSDLQVGLGEIDRQAGYQTQDLDTALTRATADYGTNTGLLGRRYTLLGARQAETAAAAGFGAADGGGLAAAVVRAGNQGIEQGALDTAISRFRGDDATARTRLAANVGQQKSQLGLGYTRSGEDMTTQLARGQRESTQFGLDLSAQRFFQAAQTGYPAPSAPANEHTKKGVTYRVKGQAANRVYTLPSGRQLTRHEWVNRWRTVGARGLGAGTLYG